MAKGKKAKTIKKKEQTKKSSSKESRDKGKRGSTRQVGGFDKRKREVLSRMRRRSQIASRRRKRDEEDEFEVRVVSIRRVAKVRSGGKSLKLSVMVVVGDKAGRVGVGVAKGRDVKDASRKAVNKAKKRMIKVPLKGQTIPHEITQKYCAANVFLKPAAPGTGVIAGGAVRAVVEVAGIKDILSKVLGSKNTIPNVYATFNALKKLRLTRFDE